MQITALRCEQDINPLGVETQQPRFSWHIENQERGVQQASYRIQVASKPELLTTDSPDIWDSGDVDSSQSILVAYGGEFPLQSRQRYFWRVRATDTHGHASDYSQESAWWEMGLLSREDWNDARWIGWPGGPHISWQSPVLPAPQFRKKFTLPSGIPNARAYICGLGYYELYVNGRKVGDRVLDPVVTQYDSRVGYATYDISEYLHEGTNVVGVLLGNGWYDCHTPDVWHFDKAPWRDYPKLLLQIEATASGELVRVISDGSWRVTDSALRFDGLRNGETYDARDERGDWLTPEYNDSTWRSAALAIGPGGDLFSQQAPPCKVIETLDPVATWEVTPGTIIYDYGQNIAGWVQLSGQASRDTQITLRYSELLNDKRDIDTKNIGAYVLGGDFQTDRYTFKGEGTEEWEPRFTYHGFRYVQLTGYPGSEPLSLRARVVHTAFEPIGTFQCSNDTLNRLQECTLWSYRGNFVGIPTDCPHREKNGWTGDAHLAAETGLYNYDAVTAYAHWLGTVADSQRSNGLLPGIVPTGGWGYNWGNGPAWDSAFLLIPWYVYLYRGDKGLLETHYDAMKHYCQFLQTMTVDGLTQWGLGDWCAANHNATAPSDLVTTAYAYECFHRLARIAEVLGNKDDAAEYDALAKMVRTRWRKEFLREEGHCAADEQSSLACALFYDFTDIDEEREAISQRLRESIVKAQGKPTFGIHGAKWVLRVLSEIGDGEAAYALLTQPEYPGWVNWLTRGATTLWEDWHGNSSQNHIMYGDISAWMYSYIGGIRPDETAPGFKHVIIAPNLVGDLTWADTTYQSPYGKIYSRWERGSEGQVTLQVSLPENTTGVVYLPTSDIGSVSEGGQPLQSTAITKINGKPTLSIGSGDYHFQMNA